MLEVRAVAGKGRGVFAQKQFKQGELIERVPVLHLSTHDLEAIDRTPLFNYYYWWEGDGGAIALGFGSLYNHSYSPNAVYVKKFAELEIEYLALRDIEIGEEVTINYNSKPDDPSPLWFKVV